MKTHDYIRQAANTPLGGTGSHLSTLNLYNKQRLEMCDVSANYEIPRYGFTAVLVMLQITRNCRKSMYIFYVYICVLHELI